MQYNCHLVHGDNWEMEDNNKNLRKMESVVLSGGRCTTLQHDFMHLEHGIIYIKSHSFNVTKFNKR